MGLAELLIIGSVAVALVLWIFLSDKAKVKVQRWDADEVESAIDWDVIRHPEIQQELEANRKINAIKRYRELTGCGLQEAKEVIEYVMQHGIPKKGKSPHSSVDIGDAGIRDLIAAGNIEEAVNIYRQFAGVDKFSAQEAVEQLQRDMRLSDPSDSNSTIESDSESINKKQSRR